jgi:hypothetical protein
MDDAEDRALLRQRQRRLGYHPYWLDEEQLFLYRPEMYIHYFAAVPQSIQVLALHRIWQSDITGSGVIDALQQAFGLAIHKDTAQMLHHKWFDLNFGPAQDQPAS